MFAAFVRDMSEQKQTEEARARLAAIVQSSDDAIVGKTLDGIILSWNLLERHTEEPAILMRIANGERVDHFETVRVRKDGRRIDVSVSISPIKDNRGRIVAASKIARDITKRKATEAKTHAQLAWWPKETFRRMRFASRFSP
jgi:two-component system, NtrC family, sensor kinase